MSAVVIAEYQGTPFSFDTAGWFNATIAAGKFSKEPYEWLRLPSTQNYIAAFKRKYGNIPELQTRRGANGGTWLHPKLAVPFARWLDDDFAVWCDDQIDQIIRGDDVSPGAIRAEYLAGYHELHDVIDVKAAKSSNIWAAHMNANKLVNRTLGLEAGQRGALPTGKVAVVSVAQQITAAAYAGAQDHHDGYQNAKKALEQLGTLLPGVGPAARIEQTAHPPPRKRQAQKQIGAAVIGPTAAPMKSPSDQTERIHS